jgi:hypothetical protein
MSYTPDWFTGLLLADTSANSGSVTLPSASTMIGRMIIIKDPKGTYAENNLGISTLVNSDQFEDGTSTVTLTRAFDYMTYIAGYGSNSIPTWFQVGGSKVSTIQTNVLSVNNPNQSGLYTELTMSNGYLLADGNFISTNYRQGFPDNFSVNVLTTSTAIVSSFYISSGITTEFLNVGTLSTILNPSFSTFQLFDGASNAYFTMYLSNTTLYAGNDPVITGVEVTVPQEFVTSSLTTSTLIAQQIAGPYQFPIQTLTFPPAQAFSPSSIGNLVGWFDASDSNYVTSQNGLVSAWIDKSMTCNLLQPASSNRPGYASNSINFVTANNSFLSNDYISYNNCSNTSIFLVFNSGIYADNGILTGYSNSANDSSNPQTFTIVNQSGSVYSALLHDDKLMGDVVFRDTNVLPKQIYEYTITSNTSANLYITGNLITSNISLYRSPPTSPEGILVGARHDGVSPQNGTFLTGNINEILYYNRLLSDTERQTVEGYLAWKWNLQSNLPTRHPFRWVQPS